MRIEIPEKYNGLWKTEDPEWFNSRKSMWKLLAKECFLEATPIQISEYRRYFLTGEKRKLGTVSRDYKFLCTPMTTSEQMIEILFDEHMFHKTEMKGILGGYYQGTLKAWSVEWYPEHAKLFANTFYTGEYRPWPVRWRGEEILMHANCGYLFSSCVGWLCSLFSGKVDYIPYIVSVEYMMNIIEPKNNPKSYRDTTKLDEMFEFAERALSDESINKRTRNVARQVLNMEKKVKKYWSQIED